MADLLKNDEELSRFIFSRRHIRADSTLRPAAFIPDPKTLRFSVYRTTGCKTKVIWRIHDTHVASVRGKSAYGRGVVFVHGVKSYGLEIDLNGVLHPRHADIVAWPDDPREQLKVAAKLSSDSEYFEKPN